MSRAHDTNFVWGEMLDYWAATGQLSRNQIASATLGGIDDGEFRALGYEASYGPGTWDINDPQDQWATSLGADVWSGLGAARSDGWASLEVAA